MNTKKANLPEVLRLPVALLVFVAAAVVSSLVPSTPAAATPSYGSITINVRQISYGDIIDRYNVASSTDYVADTLCNEWICGWNDHALAAGAVIIRGVAFWEMSRRWNSNCHSVTDEYGYWDTQSSWRPEQSDQRYINGSAVNNFGGRPLGIVGAVPDWHTDYAGDYVYTDYGSDIQNQTQTLAGQGMNWQQIIHAIYDGRLTGSGCNPRQYLSPAVVITQN